MGAWDTKPWDNDLAADFYADLFASTKLAEKIEETLKGDIEEEFERVRAAAALLVFLGRNYVWPVALLDKHLSLAIERLEAITKHEELQDAPNFLSEIKQEIALLRARKDRSPPPNSATAKAWWLKLR